MADEANAGAGSEGAGPGGGKSSGRSLTWLWMLLSLVVVGGFLFWLGAVSEPSEVAVVETEEETEAVPPGVTAVPRDSLADDKARYEGQQIQVAGVEATGQLGPGIFWGELGDETTQVPVLVRLDSAASEGFQMSMDARYTLVGLLLPMSDSAAAAWEEAGEFGDEDAAMQAAFTDYYIQARSIRQSRDAR